MPSEQIPHDNISWYSFDFPDITVVPETTYYIIVRSNDTNYGYCMGYNGSNRYPRGNAWLCDDGNWTAHYSEDCAFRTYSINDQPPNPPIITGPSWGITNVNYTFCVTWTDPEADNFYFMWNWGDGNTSEWLGPYASGQTICSNHSWSQKGTYEILVKLKDIHGVEINSDPHDFNVYELKKAFIFGKITNLSTQGDYITFEAVKTRVITFSPFSFNTYISGENFIIPKNDFIGRVLIRPHSYYSHIIALCKILI